MYTVLFMRRASKFEAGHYRSACICMGPKKSEWVVLFRHSTGDAVAFKQDVRVR
jgi:hypothetical protein